MLMKIEERFVIDTNILIYFFNSDSEFHDFSQGIINDNPGNVCIVHKSISEFVCVLSKLKRYDIIENELKRITSEFNILYPDIISDKIFADLLIKHKPSGNRVYDIEIASVMISNDIHKIATFNVNDYNEIDEIEIITGKISK